jgi:hypothetical protein
MEMRKIVQSRPSRSSIPFMIVWIGRFPLEFAIEEPDALPRGCESGGEIAAGLVRSLGVARACSLLESEESSAMLTSLVAIL